MPLEKERFKVGYISETLSKYINDYLTGLSEDKRIEVAAKNYAFDSDVKVNAYVYGFDVNKVKAFLSKKLGSKLLNCEETKLFWKMIIIWKNLKAFYWKVKINLSVFALHLARLQVSFWIKIEKNCQTHCSEDKND